MPSTATASSAPSWLTPANLLRASIAVAVLTIALLPSISKKRDEVFTE